MTNSGRGMSGGFLRRMAGVIAASLAVVFLASAVHAQDRLKGVALIIGQSDYRNIARLPNPANDARAIEDLLNRLGFDTDISSDRDARRLRRDLDSFVEDAEGADVAVIYYSGHGIEAGGENFLIPVDADVPSLRNARERLVSLSSVMAELKKTVPVAIFLLDACRNNPFPPDAVVQLDPGSPPQLISAAGLGQSRGVVALGDARPSGVDESLGQVIGFAAEPGRVALDGDAGGNSPYAAALLRHLSAMGGEEFGTVLRMVGEEVYLKTGGRQRPWVNESLRRLLYFGTPADLADGEEGDILGERRRLLVSIAALPDPERRQIEAIARSDGVPMDALYGMLRTLGSDTPKDAAELDRLLRSQSARLKQILAERETLKSTDAEIVRLSGLARKALDEGALGAAQKFHDRAKARVGELSKTIDNAEAEIATRRREFAEVFARSAETSELAFDFLKASEDYGKAYEQVSRWDPERALLYRSAEARALGDHGEYVGDNAVLARSVEIYGQALALASKDRDAKAWAALQNNFARTLSVLGERETGRTNLDRSVAAYEAALTVYTRDAAPDDWASTYGNLATVYWRLGQRDNSDELLRRAVAALREVLAVQSPGRIPMEWAATQNNLGVVLSEIGERETSGESLLASIAAQEAALTVYTRQSAPMDWAQSQLNLGAALVRLGTQRKDVELLRRSIAAHEAAAGEMTRERVPAHWASIQNNLSSAWLAIGEIDGDDAALEAARVSAEAALSVWNRERAPANWANGQVTRGNALLRLGEKAKSPEMLNQSLAAFQAAGEVYDKALVPRDWALIHQNMGSAYAALGDIETGTDSLAKAVDAFRAAQTVYTPGEAPEDFALAGFGLANALSRWGDRKNDEAILKQAVEAYDAVLVVRKREANPQLWGRTMYRLAAALMMAGKLDGENTLMERSVATYRAALEAQAVADTPDRVGATRWGLGHVLAALGSRTGDVAMLLEATTQLEAALPAYAAGGEDWAQIHRDGGYAWYAAGQATSDQKNYTRALAAFDKAREVYGKLPDVERLARLDGEIGVCALMAAGQGDVALLRRSVEAYERALRVLTKTAYPPDWASASNNLASALTNLGYFTNDTTAFRRAADIYRDIATLRTREAAPDLWVRNRKDLAYVLGNLGSRTSDPAVFEEAVAVNRELAEATGKDADPASWATFQNDIGYNLTLLGRARGDARLFEEAVPILREAVAVQGRIGDVPAIAYTQDSLCDVLVDLGKVRREKAMAQEAIVACDGAISIFRDQKLDDLLKGSETNLAEANALLKALE